jgi:hypothetical protein
VYCFVVSALRAEAKVAIFTPERNEIPLHFVELRRKTYHVIPERYVFLLFKSGWPVLTLSLLMSYIYGAPSKARNLTSYIYGRDFYWGFCLFNRAFR